MRRNVLRPSCSDWQMNSGKRREVLRAGPALVRRCFDGFEDPTQIRIASPDLDGGRGPHGLLEFSLVWSRNNEGLALKRRRRPDYLQQIPAAGVGHSNVINHHVGSMLLDELADFVVGLGHVRKERGIAVV